MYINHYCLIKLLTLLLRGSLHMHVHNIMYQPLPLNSCNWELYPLKSAIYSMSTDDIPSLSANHTLLSRNFLSPHHPKPARFYLLPKVHKPGNPGPPIVASNGTCTENISTYVDYHLCPLVTSLPSFIQDTTNFLRKLKSLPSLPENTLLVTQDVHPSTTIYMYHMHRDLQPANLPLTRENLSCPYQ